MAYVLITNAQIFRTKVLELLAVSKSLTRQEYIPDVTDVGIFLHKFNKILYRSLLSSSILKVTTFNDYGRQDRRS